MSNNIRKEREKEKKKKGESEHIPIQPDSPDLYNFDSTRKKVFALFLQ